MAVEAAPRTLDPRFATDATSSRIAALVFRGLTRGDGTGRRLPDLARDWNVSDGGRTVTFHLREARFHDGSPITSADVRATLESVLDPTTASPKRAGLEAIERVESPDPATVVFRLRQPFAPILEAAGLGVLPAREIRGREPVAIGSGPFRLVPGTDAEETRLRAAAAGIGIPEILFRVVPDDTVRALELERGTIHLAENAIEPQNLERLARLEHLCVRRVPGTTFHYLGLNLRSRPLDDPRVRRAIAAAIDREAITRSLLASTARPATGLFAPGHWAYEPDVTRHPHDPALARRLLDEAGWPDPDGPGPGMRFTLAYKTTPLESRRRLAAAIQAYLREVGVGVDVRSFEWATFYADVRRGDYQLHSLAWIGVEDPDLVHHLFHSSMMPPRGDNRGGYARPEMDELTTSGRSTVEPEARRRIYGAVQKLAAYDLPLVPLWWSETIAVHDRRLRGFVPAPDGDLGSLAVATLEPRATGPCEP
ncbi:MAG: ABC transporter substrate-binding protein [Candidatus Binatia bacterium]